VLKKTEALDLIVKKETMKEKEDKLKLVDRKLIEMDVKDLVQKILVASSEGRLTDVKSVISILKRKKN
jgi:hypothetical protein